GSFKFGALASNQTFQIIAEFTQDGIYRKGYVEGRTPSNGGPLTDLIVVLREQSSVEGQVVDDAGHAVPLARFWLRELTWPYQEFGKSTEPLTADKNGRFVINNVFAGPFRLTAVSPDQGEIRGDYQGEIHFEGDTSQTSLKVVIGAAGRGR